MKFQIVKFTSIFKIFIYFYWLLLIHCFWSSVHEITKYKKKSIPWWLLRVYNFKYILVKTIVWSANVSWTRRIWIWNFLIFLFKFLLCFYHIGYHIDTNFINFLSGFVTMPFFRNLELLFSLLILILHCGFVIYQWGFYKRDL